MKALKRAFSLNNLTQVSTWYGIIRILGVAGYFHLAPVATDQLARAIAQSFMAAQLLIGFIDMYRNGNKTIMVAPTNQPVYAAGEIQPK